jgi:hypothetical protein
MRSSDGEVGRRDPLPVVARCLGLAPDRVSQVRFGAIKLAQSREVDVVAVRTQSAWRSLEVNPVTVSVSIDTEEDNWGSFAVDGAMTRNIAHLAELQDLFDKWGARPTYLVNRPPLMNGESVEALGRLAGRDDVEIGAHCHPWNTPPFTGEGESRSMMNGLTVEENRGKIRDVAERLRRELGVEPRTFRAGRWGFGPSVARALIDEGFAVDCSVSPFMDWTSLGGADFTHAPRFPYRFAADRPFLPDSTGALLEIPTTVGFLQRGQSTAGRIRRTVAKSPLEKGGVLGLLDILGLVNLRWLSPEASSADTMVRLTDAMVSSGAFYLQMTFHSCTLLPGATPFVRSRDDRARFLESIDLILGHCKGLGCSFRTLGEVAELVDSGAFTDPDGP